MPLRESPYILLITDDPSEESHTTHILSKYHFTNSLVKLRKSSDAVRYFSAWNSVGKEATEPLPEIIILSIRDSGRFNLSLVMESRRGEMGGVPLIVVTDAREEEEEIRRLNLARVACISRPVGFFKLLEAMQKLGMRWVVLRPEA